MGLVLPLGVCRVHSIRYGFFKSGVCGASTFTRQFSHKCRISNGYQNGQLLGRSKDKYLYQLEEALRSMKVSRDKRSIGEFLQRCNVANNLPLGFPNEGLAKLPNTFGRNQEIHTEGNIEEELQLIVSKFEAPVEYAFGYGSGVFKQTGYEDFSSLSMSKQTSNSMMMMSRPQIDLIIAVDDPIQFHTINMKQNPSHYSSIKYGGSHFLTVLQNLGAGIFFNPFVTIAGHEVKYGVVSMSRLIQDLSLWDSFYLAGRLQKPVKIIKNHDVIKYWNQLNLKSAATLAKHLLQKENNKFNEFEFYKKITGLSYLGDIRYTVGGENPNKVNNIINQNFHNFQLYYKPIYDDVILNDKEYLPPGYSIENSLKILERNIRRTSAIQTLKGILTAGATKSIKYAWNKKMKVWKGK